MPVPPDYLERVYAGVLGKLIGVYLGRPFENWTHQEILKKLGHIRYYVNDQFDVPLVVTDDDVSGTFVFPRALEEHGVTADLRSEAIGNTWLNNVIKYRTIFWWGGNGISTEHTAYLNLKKGIKAPHSGSIETNGKTVAEQIGAQIFIDGWAMLAPGNPELAVQLAEAAARVSHDGKSVHAAKLFAAMEAEAFVSKDVDHLVDTGLQFVPKKSLIAQLISNVRIWSKEDNDWERTRQRIEDTYGYDKFEGNCHVIPNHGIMTLALLYGGHSFHEAMHIINTCGWDTDCNSGNIGCLVAIMHGVQAFEGGPDWRGPIADRALISSADPGYSINNASRIAHYLASMGRQLAGELPLKPPKGGAQFHFTLPGSVQGFQVSSSHKSSYGVKIEQTKDDETGQGCLRIFVGRLDKDKPPLEIMTPTFTPPDVTKMKIYDLMASPLVYPGQTITSHLRASQLNSGSVEIRFCVKVYTTGDALATHTSVDKLALCPGAARELKWKIPDNMDSQPIQQLGIALFSSVDSFAGLVWLDYLMIDGSPQLRLQRPVAGPSDFWRRAWANNVSTFRSKPQSFYLAQDEGEGTLIYGTRDWKDYKVEVSNFKVNLGAPSGVAVRVQGLRRYYAFLLMPGWKRVAFVKVLDDSREELATGKFGWKLDKAYKIIVNVSGTSMQAHIDGKNVLKATDNRYQNGGIGLVLTNGSISAEMVDVGTADL